MTDFPSLAHAIEAVSSIGMFWEFGIGREQAGRKCGKFLRAGLFFSGTDGMADGGTGYRRSWNWHMGVFPFGMVGLAEDQSKLEEAFIMVLI